MLRFYRQNMKNRYRWRAQPVKYLSLYRQYLMNFKNIGSYLLRNKQKEI